MTVATPGVQWTRLPDGSWRPVVTNTGGVSTASPRFAVGDILLSLPNYENFVYGHMGDIEVLSGTLFLYLDGAYTVVTARAYLTTAPVGADAIVVLNKNGSAANTITIADGDNTAVDTTATTFDPGDLITVDITQVGSTTPGADLTVLLRMLETG
jgi:hypothetical protein